MPATALIQRTDEWIEARKSLISATDVPVLLGLSPYKSEAELAREKLGEAERQAETLPMRVGTALEPVIAMAYEEATGRRVRRMLRLYRHPDLEWAAASPDFRVLGEKRLVEAKYSTAGRWADGLPQDVESQVQWQLAVTGYDVADVAALLHGRELRVYEVERDDALFADLVAIAEDFRARLLTGGPFAESAASVKARYPADNGAEMLADGALDTAVRELVRVRGDRKALEEREDALETAVKERMGEFAVLRGPGWQATWKRTKDREETDWRSLAAGLLRQLPEPERDALVGLHSSVRQGFRPFRLVMKEDEA